MAKLIAIIMFVAVITLATSPSTFSALGNLANHTQRNVAALDY